MPRWIWLFPLTYLVHIAEEYWAGERFFHWLSRVAGATMTSESFLLLNGAFLAVMTTATWVAVNRRNHMAAIVLANIVLINTLLHTLGSVLTGSYSPGVVSALVLWLPLAIATIYRTRGQISAKARIGAATIAVVAHVVVSLLALDV